MFIGKVGCEDCSNCSRRPSRINQVLGEDQERISEEFQDETILLKSKQNTVDKILDHMKRSSLFIFNENWKIRKILLLLMIPSEQIIPKDDCLNNPKEFGITNLESPYIIDDLQIINGKILADKKYLKYSKVFEIWVIILIFISSILLWLVTPLSDPNSQFVIALGYIDYIITFLFLTEAIMKIIAFGFFL